MGITQESFDAFVQMQTSYNQFFIFGLALVAGCVLGSMIMRFFR